MDKVAEILNTLAGHPVILVSHGVGEQLRCRHGHFQDAAVSDDKGVIVLHGAYYTLFAARHEVEIRPDELSIVFSRFNAFGDPLANAFVFCPGEDRGAHIRDTLLEAAVALAEAR